MIKMPLSVFRVAAFCLPLALVASCGTGSEAVQATVINLDPPNFGAIGLDIEGFVAVDYSQIVRIEAKSPTGTPQIGVQLLVDSGFVVYEGHPQVVCTPIVAGIRTCSAPSATPLTTPYTTTTGSNGTYEITVIFTVSPFSTGDITTVQAWSGTGYNFAIVTSECLDSAPSGGIADCA